MPLKNGAQPYQIISSKRWMRLTRTLGPKAGAAGGWISTAGDLYRFLQALHSGRLLKPAALKTMRTAAGAAPTDSAYRFYAYGLETFVNGAVKGAALYGHNGGGAGFSIDAFVDAKSGYIVVSCTNLRHNSRPLAQNYFRAALGQTVKPVLPSPALRVNDAVDAVSFDIFLRDHKAQFAALGIQPQPGLFADLSEGLEAAGDLAGAARWLALGRDYFPEDGILWLLSGDLAMAGGSKAEAKAFFEQAQIIAEKAKDERMLQAVREKTAGL